MSRRSWTDEQLIQAVQSSTSYRQVIKKLGLVPAGGNYEQVQSSIKRLKLDTDHFKGMGWSLGLKVTNNPSVPIENLLVNGSRPQSYKLKNRLFAEGLKLPKCEICGWSKISMDGRIPVELDHVNGDHYDNRIENLRILCPNCHSLQLSHRGRNKGRYKE